MLQVTLRLVDRQSGVFYAGDPLRLLLSFVNTEPRDRVQVLSGSVQLVGRAMFASDVFRLDALHAHFGPLARIKDDQPPGGIVHEDGTIHPAHRLFFHLTNPAVMAIPSEHPQSFSLEWRGTLREELPPSFTGPFVVLQHVVLVRVTWKSSADAQILTETSELPIRVVSHPKWLAVPLIPWLAPVAPAVASCADRLDCLLADDETVDATRLAELRRQIAWNDDADVTHAINNHRECDRIVRELCDNPTDTFKSALRIRSVGENTNTKTNTNTDTSTNTSTNTNTSMNTDTNTNTDTDTNTDTGTEMVFAVVEVRRLTAIAGGQLFVSLRFCDEGDRNGQMTSGDEMQVRVALECVETYSRQFLLEETNEDLSWTDRSRERGGCPGGLDRMDFVIPLPPDCQSSYACDIFRLTWQLRFSFHLPAGGYEFVVPIRILRTALTLRGAGEQE